MLNIHQVRGLCQHGMITPYVESTKELDGKPCVSFGLSPSGYDVRATREWQIADFTQLRLKGGYIVSDIKDPASLAFETYCIKREGSRIVLPPKSFVTTSTLETFAMPDNVAGICIGKSTYARQGIVTFPTPLQPGWRGNLVLEFANTSERSVAIYPDEGVAYIMFFEVGDTEPYSSVYQDQRGNAISRL